MCGHGVTDPFGRVGDLGHQLGWKPNSDCHMVGVVVEPYLELGDFEQGLELRLGCVSEVEREVRERVEQRHVLDAGKLGRVGFVRGVELGEPRERCALLGFQIVVAATQCLGERVAWIAILSLPEDTDLFPF